MELPRKHGIIMQIFGIDWVNDITWKDLLKPLYSGIAARLYLSNFPEEIPSCLPDQARYWVQYYNGDSAARFIERVTAGEHLYGW